MFRGMYHLALADFLERVRRYGFLITLGFTLLVAYLFVPSTDADYVAVGYNNYRGLYNSAWIGNSVAVSAAIFLILPAFYLVRGAISRDRDTGVGQILATTRMGKLSYVAGKFVSNLAVLAAVVGVLAAGSGVMQLVRGEDLGVNPVALLTPFVLVVLPVMALVAALALLFETVPFLRGTLGNVAFFFLWVTGLSFAAVSAFSGGSGAIDVLGIGAPLASMFGAAEKAVPPGANASLSIIASVPGSRIETFEWSGVDWTSTQVLSRLFWACVAGGIALVAALPFDRFDPARRAIALPRPTTPQSAEPAEAPAEIPSSAPATAPATAPAAGRTSLTPLDGGAGSGSTRFFGVLVAELKLMVLGRRWWWYAIFAVLVVACLFAPLDSVQNFLLPVALLWPIALWSSMGSRETQHHTEGLVFSAAKPPWSQLPTAWLAGVLVAALAGSGGLVRLLLAGEGAALLGWGVAVLFVPSLALALGVLTGTTKVFEALYLLWWYMGSIEDAPPLDFIGAFSTSFAIGAVYVVLVGALLALAVFGRGRQLVT